MDASEAARMGAALERLSARLRDSMATQPVPRMDLHLLVNFAWIGVSAVVARRMEDGSEASSFLAGEIDALCAYLDGCGGAPPLTGAFFSSLLTRYDEYVVPEVARVAGW